MTVLTIGCIIILMIVALNFIWEAERARFDLRFSRAMNWLLHEHLQSTVLELQKYKRPRDAQGRFIKGGS